MRLYEVSLSLLQRGVDLSEIYNHLSGWLMRANLYLYFESGYIDMVSASSDSNMHDFPIPVYLR